MHQKRITKSQFKARALEYIGQIEATGETVVITDRGRPVIELVPYRLDKRSPLEVLRGSVIEFKTPLDPISTDNWGI